MKALISLLVLLGSVTIVFAQERAVPIKEEVVYSSISKGGGNYLVLKNVDGINSTITCNVFSVTLTDPDMTQYDIQYNRKISTLTNPDGTKTVIHHKGKNSILLNDDGSRYVIYHDRRYSTLMSSYGTLIVRHNYEMSSYRWRSRITDILVHKRWIDQAIAAKELTKLPKKNKRVKKRNKIKTS
ncbi:MAG: hypothetical protein AB8G22_28325 [Saprospiraceae bacterium]